jgi:F-type H+-transporting ATPase subunit epsilon
MTPFSVDILTPNKVLAKNLAAESLLLPTVRGEINILPEHTHLITQLSKGAVTIFSADDEEDDRAFFISDGICKVLKNKVVIMASLGEEVNHIDLDRAQRSLEHSMEHLKTKTLSPHEFDELVNKIERAKLRIQLASTYKGKISE